MKRLLVALFLWIAGLRHGASQPAEPAWNVRLLGQLGGACGTVDVVGQYAYIGEGPNLRILDVSNPSQPVSVGNLYLGDFLISQLRVRSGVAYVAGWAETGRHGLQIVDVSNPRSPRLVSFFPTPHEARGLSVTNGVAYVAYGWYDPNRGGISIVDVANPSSPTLRGSFETGSFTFRVFVGGGIAYVATDNGLCIYDVTDPTAARRLSVVYAPYCSDTVVRGNLAYTAYGSGGLLITDVTSPTAPARRGRYDWGSCYGLAVEGNRVFLLNPTSGLKIVDVANPSSPTSVGSLRTSGTALSVAVSSGTAYVADQEGGLLLVDVRNPTGPTLRSSYDTLSGVSDVQVIGNVAYVANGPRGFKAINVSNHGRPWIIASRQTRGFATAIAVSENLAHLTGVPVTGHNSSSFQIVDVTTPSLPWLRGFWTNFGGYDIAASGGLAYFAAGGLRIVDVSNPSSPRLRGSINTPGYAMGVFVADGFAYLADYFDLRIIDVRNPVAPVSRSSLYLYHSVTDVQVANGTAYVIGMGDYNVSTLSCVDVRSPGAPRRVGQYTAGFTYDTYGGLYVKEGYAYAVMDHLRILDVRDPTKLILRGYYPTGYQGRPFVVGDLIYLAGWQGLRIFQFTGRVSAAPRWQLYR